MLLFQYLPLRPQGIWQVVQDRADFLCAEREVIEPPFDGLSQPAIDPIDQHRAKLSGRGGGCVPGWLGLVEEAALEQAGLLLGGDLDVLGGEQEDSL